MDLLPAARANQLSNNMEQTDMGHKHGATPVIYDESYHAGGSIVTGTGNRASVPKGAYHANGVANSHKPPTSQSF